MFKTMRLVDDYAQTALVYEHTFYMINVCVCAFTYVSSFGIILNFDETIASILYYMQPRTGPLRDKI